MDSDPGPSGKHRPFDDSSDASKYDTCRDVEHDVENDITEEMRPLATSSVDTNGKDEKDQSAEPSSEPLTVSQSK
jgi:hypothetical protein